MNSQNIKITSVINRLLVETNELHEKTNELRNVDHL